MTIKISFKKTTYDNVDELVEQNSFNECKSILFFGLRKELDELPSTDFSNHGLWIDGKITFVYSTNFLKEGLQYLISTFEQGIVLRLNNALPLDKDILGAFFMDRIKNGG